MSRCKIRLNEISKFSWWNKQKGNKQMAIGNAVERGSSVYVYDEKNHLISTHSSGSGPRDGLKGYTNTTVNIQRGSTIYTYGERGQLLGTRYAG